MSFYLYKNLKKPMIFFGLRGKYIYWAIGVIISGLILVVALGATVGMLGTLVGVVLVVSGLWGVYIIQDKNGLYNRTKNNDEVHVFPKKFKISRK